MNELVFEQPLNEKVRNYLRLEHLARQLDTHLHEDHQHRCFFPLFSLCELSERCDFRNELLKDVDKLLVQFDGSTAQQQMSSHQQTFFLEQLAIAKDELQKPDRPGVQLKQNRFIAAVRQKLNLTAACCNFDLPQLHFWLAKPWAERQQEYQQWVEHFHCLLHPISILLQLTRMSSDYQQAVAHAGFYHDSSPNNLSLVRVKLNADDGCYPTISGHRNRFAIHFVQFEQQKHSQQTVKFLLATCS
ncbi:cell division protein ZapD [Shewanella fodinae]|uniref:cell division protein ZapD n=1 Tax=Shewanella fodinae TaxID=552357 RepID=UPI001674BEBF|nr:cell division protein ZapD [Shewanella fodinae]MCL2907753.1 cell division protein ZapD [Shewanella fodinae]GGZ09972.1 cell division protein ZapD [Shewanella fodinae]